MDHPIDDLRSLLDDMAGNVKKTEELITTLAACWDEFDGGRAEAMESWKLRRMEKPEWKPPVFVSTIERHGGTVLGSTRAELQRWEVNLDTKEASCFPAGRRQVAPTSPRANFQQVAQELAPKILSKQEDERLKWKSDGSVQVVMTRVFPDSVAQTLSSRSKRLREELLKNLGSEWQVKPGNLFSRIIDNDQ